MTQTLRIDAATGELLLFEGDVFLEILKFAGDPSELPLNVPVIVEHDGPTLIDVREIPQPKAMRVGKPRIDVAIAAIGQHGFPPSQSAINAVAVFAARLQADISMLVGDTHKVLVTPYAFECPRLAGLSLRYFEWALFRDHVNAVNPDHQHTHWMGVGGPKDGGVCGRAWLGGKQAWVHAGCGYGTVIHELGHNLGFDHSGTPTNEYGDRLSWMGNGERRQAFIAPHHDVFGLYGDKTAHMAADTGARSIMLVDAQSDATITPEGHAHFITANTREGEIGIGYIAGMVRIYKQSWPGSWQKTQVIENHALDVTVGGLRIERGETERSAVLIRLTRDTFAGSVPDPAPWKPTPDPDGPVIDVADLNGVWASDATYQGVFIWELPEGRRDNADVLIGWLTWDRTGEPRYLYAICHLDLDRRSFAGTLESTRKTRTTGPEPYEDGAVCFHRAGEDLVMRYDSLTLGRGEMTLNRRSTGDGGERWGWYALEGVEHAGLLVSTNRPGPSSPSGTAAMYLIDHDTGSFPKGNGQRWRYIDGPNASFGGGEFKLRKFTHPQRFRAKGWIGVETVGAVEIDEEVTEITIREGTTLRRHQLRPVFGE